MEKGGEGARLFWVFINGDIPATGTRWPLLERRTAKMPAEQRLRKILARSLRRRQPFFGGERRRRRRDFCRYVLKEASLWKRWFLCWTHVNPTDANRQVMHD